jgi:Tetratricopeptide repeat
VRKLNPNFFMKSLVCILISLFVAGNGIAFAQTTPVREVYLQGVKEQFSFPPGIISFIGLKEQQAKDIAQKNGFELPDDYMNFFAAARAGRVREAKQLFHGLYNAFYNNASGTNLTPVQKSPLFQVVLDVSLADDAFNGADTDLVMALGQDLMNSLPANCIYFGGTDPGRGLPTMLCKAPGDPVCVLTQNALCDGRYVQYVRDMYGSRIHLPATNDVQEIMDTYYADAQRRSEHDLNFSKEPKQLRPDEKVSIINGKPKVEGFGAYAALNGLIAKTNFDKNPDREFYVEVSFPLDWMYPYLSPHGPILKLNRLPLPAIPADDLTADAAYWSAKVVQLKGNLKFSGDDYIGKAYAHMRASIAGLYAWRAQSPKDNGENQKMFQAAESAYKQALALYPAAPEAVNGLVNLVLTRNRLDDALTVAKNAVAADPFNGQMKTLLGQLQKFEQQKTTAAATPATNVKPNPQQQLKQLKEDFDAGKIDEATYEQKKAVILNSL